MASSFGHHSICYYLFFGLSLFFGRWMGSVMSVASRSSARRGAIFSSSMNFRSFFAIFRSPPCAFNDALILRCSGRRFIWMRSGCAFGGGEGVSRPPHRGRPRRPRHSLPRTLLAPSCQAFLLISDLDSWSSDGSAAGRARLAVQGLRRQEHGGPRPQLASRSRTTTTAVFILQTLCQSSISL